MASDSFADGAVVGAVAGTSVDDYDDFNSFLETVLSDDEPAATLPGERALGDEKSGAPSVPLENGKQEASGGGRKAKEEKGSEVAGAFLTADDMESACATGVTGHKYVVPRTILILLSCRIYLLVLPDYRWSSRAIRPTRQIFDLAEHGEDKGTAAYHHQGRLLKTLRRVDYGEFSCIPFDKKTPPSEHSCFAFNPPLLDNILRLSFIYCWNRAWTSMIGICTTRLGVAFTDPSQ